MNKLTKEQMADRLNGREMGEEIDGDEQLIAKNSGLLVIFGHSDDCTELRGAIHDETTANTLHLHRHGLLARHDPDCECPHCKFHEQAEQCLKVRPCWCVEDGYSWTYDTPIPHATFDILEGSDKFCRGIVIDINDLPEVKL